MFGQPVQLTYKGEPTFSTCCGGLVSLLFMLVMTLVVSIQFYKLVKYPEFESYAPTYDYSHQQFDIDKTMSMIAVKLEGINISEKRMMTLREVSANIRVSF